MLHKPAEIHPEQELVQNPLCGHTKRIYFNFSVTEIAPKMAGNRFERFLANFYKLPKGKARDLKLDILGLILLLISCLSE